MQAWLRGRSAAHERAAPTSKLFAYHLEIWFSSNRCGPPFGYMFIYLHSKYQYIIAYIDQFLVQGNSITSQN